jgi:hypothetical protein
MNNPAAFPSMNNPAAFSPLINPSAIRQFLPPVGFAQRLPPRFPLQPNQPPFNQLRAFSADPNWNNPNRRPFVAGSAEHSDSPKPARKNPAATTTPAPVTPAAKLSGSEAKKSSWFS